MDQGKKITGSSSGVNWDRDGFRAWEQWTSEDFHYHEVETDHMTIKNSPLMQEIVLLADSFLFVAFEVRFKELGGFCGMD